MMNSELRILILEDVPEDAELIERILRKEKLQCTARAVDNKRDFLKELKDFSPDLVLSDYTMPRFTGLEALEMVKEIAPSTPFIIITGSINEETAVECIKAGAVDYVLKDRLIRIGPAVEAALENKRIRDEKARVEKALAASACEWETTFDAINDAVCLLDMEGNVLRCNTAMKNLVGKPFYEIIGKDCSGLFRDVTSPDILCPFDRMQESLQRETTLVELNNRWLDILVDPILDETGALIGGVQIVSDVTERRQAEEALRESEELYRSLFENMLNGFAYCRMLFDKDRPQDFIYLDVNKAFETLTGLKNVVGKKVSEVIPGIRDLDPTLFEIYGRVALTGKPERFEIYVKSLKMWFSVSVYSPKKEYFVAVFDVITERKQTEEKIKESELRYRSLFEHTAEGILIAELETKKFRYANPAICKMLGYSVEELREMGVEDIHPRAELGNVISEFEAQARGEKTLVQLPCLRKDGEIVYANISATKALIDGRECKIGFFTNVTEQRRSEEERILLATAIEQAAECIIITDIQGTIKYVNPAFEKITGFTREEAIGQNPRILKSGRQDEAFYKTMWDTILSGRMWKGQIVNKRKDGTYYQEKASISPVKDMTGAIMNFAAVTQDITNEVLIEQRLLQSQKLEAIGTLAGGIAHDFNNILSAILGYTELSMDQVPEETQVHSDLQKIYSAGNRAKKLANQILTFSRQREQEKKPITITPIVKESLKLLRASLPATIEIRQNIELEPGIVMADPTQIHQVIMNLCTNAGHAMSEKGGILEVSLTSEELDSEFCSRHPGLAPGPYLKLVVSDTGHGIAPDIVPRIFEPFFTTRDKMGGTGMGLAVVHGIVTGYDGTITVYSEPGKGATFKVYLPVTSENAVAEIEKTSSVTKGHERILLIDDEQDLVEVGKRILEQLGYTVTINMSSMEALDLFQKDPYQFDLVISDMTMPFMTGDELAEEFMRIRQDIPIIICTGYSEKLTEERALSIGIRAYMGKPLLKSEIAETVRRVLDQQSKDI